MAWEKRAGQRYFYTAHRVGERIVKEYQGCGARAEVLALWQEHLRERQEWETVRRCALLSESLRVERELRQFLSALRDLASAFIEAEGYHRPSRGRWRKRRKKTMVDESSELGAIQPSEGLPLLPCERKSRRKLLHRSLNPKATNEELRMAARVLREAPDTTPGYSEIKRFMSGGLTAVIAQCVEDSYEQRLLLADSENEIDRLAGGVNVAPALKLLASCVVASRLHLAMAEAQYRDEKERYEREVLLWQNESLAEAERAMSTRRTPLLRPRPMLNIAALDRQLERAQRRHLEALKALMDAQRLPLPTVQIAAPGGSIVNVADKQINVSR